MQSLVLSKLEPSNEVVEVVERKGLGHPDTICDAPAETLSRNLCREYRERFGRILHHNVDKILLVAAKPRRPLAAARSLLPSPFARRAGRQPKSARTSSR